MAGSSVEMWELLKVGLSVASSVDLKEYRSVDKMV